LEELPELPSMLQDLKCELSMYDRPPIILIGMNPFMVEQFNQENQYWLKELAESSKERCLERCAIYKEQIMMKAWHPSRVEKLLEMGYDIEDM